MIEKHIFLKTIRKQDRKFSPTSKLNPTEFCTNSNGRNKTFSVISAIFLNFLDFGISNAIANFGFSKKYCQHLYLGSDLLNYWTLQHLRKTFILYVLNIYECFLFGRIRNPLRIHICVRPFHFGHFMYFLFTFIPFSTPGIYVSLLTNCLFFFKNQQESVPVGCVPTAA